MWFAFFHLWRGPAEWFNSGNPPSLQFRNSRLTHELAELAAFLHANDGSSSKDSRVPLDFQVLTKPHQDVHFMVIISKDSNRLGRTRAPRIELSHSCHPMKAHKIPWNHLEHYQIIKKKCSIKLSWDDHLWSSHNYFDDHLLSNHQKKNNKSAWNHNEIPFYPWKTIESHEITIKSVKIRIAAGLFFDCRATLHVLCLARARGSGRESMLMGKWVVERLKDPDTLIPCICTHLYTY